MLDDNEIADADVLRDPPHHRWLAVVAVGLVVFVTLIVYTWIVSAGSWLNWPTYTVYHQKLADAFRNGQTYLLELPRPELLALPDPYDPSASEPYRLHDATLFNGRYYLYWGPVPALIVAVINWLLRGRQVPDQGLVFLFSLGAVVLATLTLLRLRRQLFPDVPQWTVAAAGLTLALAAPMSWALGRGSVYEVAITAMQFFLIAGIYCAIRAIDRPSPSKGWLLATGMCLACAAGSRVSCAIAVAGIAGVLALWIYQSRQSVLPAMLALLLPLVAGAGALAAYNYARFGSPTELGIRYQLAGFNTRLDHHQLTSIQYVVPNVYSYLFRTPVPVTLFPFVLPRNGLESAAFPSFISRPPNQIAGEPTAGLLVATPFAWLVLMLPVAAVAKRRLRPNADTDRDPRGERQELKWVVAMLVVGALLATVPALVLSLAALRYQLDWTMPTLLLAVLGFWSGWRLFRGRLLRFAWLVLGAALAFWTVAVGPLLAVTGTDRHFATHNPIYLKRLMEATYRGAYPAVAQVTHPVGVDAMPHAAGWWVGQNGALLDIMVARGGRYSLDMSVVVGPCLEGRATTEINFAMNPEQPFSMDALSVVATTTLAGESVSTPAPINVQLRLYKGLNRIYLFVPDPPTHPDGPEPRGCRRKIGIDHLMVSDAPQ